MVKIAIMGAGSVAVKMAIQVMVIMDNIRKAWEIGGIR